MAPKRQGTRPTKKRKAPAVTEAVANAKQALLERANVARCAAAGEGWAQARQMREWLELYEQMRVAVEVVEGRLVASGLPATVPLLVAKMYKVFVGSVAARRLAFLEEIDMRARFPDGAYEDLNALLAAWRAKPKAGPKEKKTDKTVWDLAAARWSKISGEDVAGAVLMRQWSHRETAAPSDTRPRRARSPRTR